MMTLPGSPTVQYDEEMDQTQVRSELDTSSALIIQCEIWCCPMKSFFMPYRMFLYILPRQMENRTVNHKTLMRWVMKPAEIPEQVLSILT